MTHEPEVTITAAAVQRQQRLLALLDEALDLPADQHAAWLDKLTRVDAPMAEHLRRLLALDVTDGSGSTLDQGAAALFNSADAGDEWCAHSGDMIGAYRLSKFLGQGGMGSVWLAVRTASDGRPAELVAIKLPRAGAGGQFAAVVTERLRREGAILASLNHPNIAALIEVGERDDARAPGAPYLILEYVEGERLADYCDRLRLAPRARLNLFLQVTSAVAAAHAALVLHRDLKPGNVIVTGTGTVKLLDFGIAKLLDESNAQAKETALTQAAGRVLTPDFASPEQIAGAPLTVASDIYSLGVMLFELLTGMRPYRLKRGSAAELEEAILQADIPPPSSQVSRAYAEHNLANPAALRRDLAGDLDAIILKALKKHPADRYATVLEFKADIERFLDGRPVIAQADSYTYRAGKFVRRHRVWVGAAVLTITAMVLGSTLALWQAGVARHEARRAIEALARADKRAQETRGIAQALIFEINDAVQSIPGATKARAKIAERATEFLDRLYVDHGDDLVLLRELAAGYQKVAEAQSYSEWASLGETRAATRSYARAVELREAAIRHASGGNDDLGHLAEALLRQSNHQAETGDPPGSLPLLRRGLHIRYQQFFAKPKDADAIRNVAIAESYLSGRLAQLDQPDAAIAMAWSVLNRFESLVANDPTSARARWGEVVSYANLANLYLSGKDDARALPLLQQALAKNRALQVDRPDHYSVLHGFATYHQMTGRAQFHLGDLPGAIVSLQEATRRAQALAARDSNDIEAKRLAAQTQGWLGRVLVASPRAADRTAGFDHLKTAQAQFHALVQSAPQQWRIAINALENAIRYAEAYKAIGDTANACARYQEAQAMVASFQTSHPTVSRKQIPLVAGC
jgi:eukaryotic-like serine/threonine-protein kinase